MSVRRPLVLASSVWLVALALTTACAGGADETNRADETSADVAPEPDDAAADDAPDAPDASDASDQGRDADTAEAPGGPPSADAADVLTVVATVAPITDLVATVGGDRIEAVSLVPPGADSHTYEPRPQDVARLSDADLYVGVGLDLNPGAVRLAAENLGDGVPMVLLGEEALADDALVMDHSHDDDGGHSHDDDSGHSHSHDDDGGHSHSHDDDGGHSHSHDDDGLGPNPHVWTSVRNASAMVEALAETLSDLDPDGSSTYRDNASALQDELAALDRSIGDATATIPAANRTLVTYHDAWTYFARDYRLEFVTAVQPADFAEPSAAEVRDVIDLIRDRGIVAVFGSEAFPTPVMDAIAEETDAVYVADLADDVLPGRPGDAEHTYLELMRRNAVTIVDALGGDTDGLGG